MNPKLKKVLKIILAILVAIMIAYFLGPKPATPKLAPVSYTPPRDLSALEQEVHTKEKTIKGIRRGCEARIVWADTTQKAQTRYAFLYIHGFGASQMEAEPIHRNLAKRYSANLYLSRLPGHGLDVGDSTMAAVTADDFANAVEYSLAIAKALGEEVILLSNSFGGALSCYLAANHPEIKALVSYSPNIRSHNKNALIFTKPWGLKMVTLFSGSPIFEYPPPNPEYAKYWTTHYHLNGLAEFQNFLVHTMEEETFKKINCPVFMGYWYKDENEKDTVASIPAMLKMFDKLGSEVKQKAAFKNVANHEMTTPILSKDVETVQKATEEFLDKILKR